MADDEDKISKLPEAILSSIVSKLEVKEAVRTGILSRNWRNAYLFMPTLKVGPSNIYRNPQTFVKTVNHMLQLYLVRKIVSFDMCFCPNGEENILQFERWMKAIARMGVENLDMTFNNSKSGRNSCFLSPRNKYSFRLELISEAADSLKHMNLCQCNLVLSPIVRFNSLKTLRLQLVPLCGEELQIIFSSCLNLERIELFCCQLPPKLSINASDELKFVDMELCEGTKSIHICAAGLVSFMFVCPHMVKLSKLSLSGVPKLKRLHLFDPNGEFPMHRVFCDFAAELPLLEWLSFRVITNELEYINAARNAFGNLKQLYLNVKVSLLPNLLNVTPILEACPVLEKFDLGIDRNNVISRDENVRMQLAHQGPNLRVRRDDSVLDISDETFSQDAGLQLWKVGSRLDKDRVETSSRCIPIRHHMHLKEVILGGFWGTDTDIELALFILKRAVVLEQMVIDGTHKTYRGKNSRDTWMVNNDARIEKSVREMIYKKLHGQAISTTAKVIIKEGGILLTRKCLV